MSRSSSNTDAGKRRWVGWAIAIACAAWIGGVGWTMLVATMPTDKLENHHSRLVHQRMAKCEGSFNQRFQCKEDILIAGDRTGFLLAMERVAFTLGLPLTVWIGWSALAGRDHNRRA